MRKLICAVLLTIMLGATAAEARRFGIPIPIPNFSGGSSSSSQNSGYSEHIDPVYTLPDTEEFRHNGVHFNLGYFYSVRNGNLTNGSFVMYHGDDFVRLDEEQLLIISSALGLDPTKDYLANQTASERRAAASISRRPDESKAEYATRSREFVANARASTALSVAPDDETTTSAPARKKGVGGTIVFVVLGFLVFGLFRRRSWVRRFLAMLWVMWHSAAAARPSPIETESSTDTSSFDDRVARRLKELSSPAPQLEQSAPPVAVKTFGRRVS